VHQSADSLKAINEYLQTTIYSKSAGLTYWEVGKGNPWNGWVLHQEF
jgi:hypothetical protein